MRNIYVILKFLLLLTLVYTITAASQWNYGQQCDDWMGTCATGKQSSPIALYRSESPDTALPQLNFGTYGLPKGGPLQLTNNGHTAELHFRPTTQGFPYISGLLLQIEAASNWNYKQQGNDWGDTCATGKRQSPIALGTKGSVVFALPRLNFGNYDLPMGGPLQLTNNGHTAELVFQPTSEGFPYISGGLLRNKYEAHSVHFHWGSPNSRGSEHVINGQRYDVEMHIVHKNNRYATLGEAQQNADGIAVLGVMLKITDVPDRIYPGLNKIFNKLPEIQSMEAKTTLTGQLTLGQLIGDLNTQEFFNYRGSLTTPECAEAVTWFVFPNALPIPRIQISKLWNIEDEPGNPLINNYRSLQSVNNRLVYYRPSSLLSNILRKPLQLFG